MGIHKRCGMFILGVGIGAATGLLLAPKRGSEIRRELFGGGGEDVFGEPGTETGGAGENAMSDEELETRIEETSARLKAEIEAQQEEDQDEDEGGEEE